MVAAMLLSMQLCAGRLLSQTVAMHLLAALLCRLHRGTRGNVDQKLRLFSAIEITGIRN
jgi:hypothetical protein